MTTNVLVPNDAIQNLCKRAAQCPTRLHICEGVSEFSPIAFLYKYLLDYSSFLRKRTAVFE